MLADIDDYFDPLASGCVNHATGLLCATACVKRYLMDYAGALFDPTFTDIWWDPNRYRASDAFAVAALSMPRFAQPAVLGDLSGAFKADAAATAQCTITACQHHIGCLLQQIPVTASIFDSAAAVWLDRANDIWTVMKTSPIFNGRQIGRVARSKLIARKRPGLAPILDIVAQSRIKRVRLANPGNNYPRCGWCFLRAEYTAANHILPGLAAVRAAVPVPAHFTDARLIDIVVWMRDNQNC